MRSLAAVLALGLGFLNFSEDVGARVAGERGLAGGLVMAVAIADEALVRRPAVAQPSHSGGSLGGLFNRPGLVGGFAAGFLGAGLLGLLFGHGVVGELSGATSLMGLFFQLALLALLARLIRVWWRADKAADTADLSPRQLADAYGRQRHEMLPDFGFGTANDVDPAAAANEREQTTLKPSDCAGR